MSGIPHTLEFPEGLAGFPEATRMQLYETEGGHPLKFLQAMDMPELSFVCVEAAAVKGDYEVPLSDAEAQSLGLTSNAEAMILLLVVVPPDPRQMTANLAAPLVVNTRTGVGRQIQLDTRFYPLQHPVFAPKEEIILEFPEGLVGYADLRNFRLFEPQGSYPLKFLQCVEKEDISFTCIDIAAIKPDYQITFSEEDATALALENPGDAMLLAMVVVPEDPRQMTANLAGPVVINTRSLRARQVVLSIEKFPLKYPILAER